MKKKYGNGFSLVELMLVLVVATIVSYIKFQELNKDQENFQAKINGEHIKKIGDAVNSYIEIRYDKLSSLANSSGNGNDPGPRTCSGNICTITYETLINENLLPKSFNGLNINKSGYNIVLKREGVSPNYIVNGLITTNNSWIDGKIIRYDLLGRSMQIAGIDSGMSKDNKVSGLNGMWIEKQADFNNINKEGLLAYRVGYNAQMYSIYLRRDGTLPMTGDLDMGNKNISNAKIVYSQKLSSTDLYVKNSAVFDGVINSLNLINSNTVKSKEFVANTNNTRITIGGGSSSTEANALSVRLEGGNSDGYMLLMDVNPLLNDSVKLDVVGSQKIRGDLKITASGNGKANGDVTASGNISGQYIKPNSIVSIGEKCVTNGLTSKILNGSPAWCVDGYWKGNEGMGVVSSGNIGVNDSFACKSGTTGKVLVQVYFNWVVYYGVYQMTANLFENNVLVESDKTAAFEYDHGRASGSSLSLFHVSNVESGKIVNYKINATSENISKVTYSCVGV